MGLPPGDRPFNANLAPVGTHLSKNGVPPRTAQAAMRHSTLDLTMLARRGQNVYTDPKLLDMGGAVETLPELSLVVAAESLLAMHEGAAGGLSMRPRQA